MAAAPMHAVGRWTRRQLYALVRAAPGVTGGRRTMAAAMATASPTESTPPPPPPPRAPVVSSGLLKLTTTGAATAELPVDASRLPGARQVRGAVFSLVDPTPLEAPRLVLHSGDIFPCSESALRLLDVDPKRAAEDAGFVAAVAGNGRFDGSEPYAHCYAGHQFGSFAGQLGDGRAICLGEVVNSRGERWELQLKGAGLTPYSRHADGRAVLRSSLREFLCSEHMHALNIPTTRAATLVASDSKVMRDPMYDGHPIAENCAVVLRLAPTFFRFGSFEIFKRAEAPWEPRGPSAGLDGKLAPPMLDWIIRTHFPHLQPAEPLTDEARAERNRSFFREVVERTARLVAAWQLVGFTHGVLNTDNMSVLGLTIDYGPFGFLDTYDPRFVANASDDSGRYRFEAQPSICYWNLARFAEALQSAGLPLDESKADLEALYYPTYEREYLAGLRAKVGLTRLDLGEPDHALLVDLLECMETTGADMTNTFRLLSRVTPATDGEQGADPVLEALLDQCCSVRERARALRPRYAKRQLEMLRQLQEQDPSTFALMMRGNEAVPEGVDPVAEGAAVIARQLERWSTYEAALQMAPEAKRVADRATWEPWLRRYRERIAAELAGAPEGEAAAAAARVAAMNAVNPKFILRNYLAQRVIQADDASMDELRALYTVLTSPFDEHPELAHYGFDRKRPESACDFMLSCSS